MQTIEALKRHIESTEELGSVVSTMKSLSAVHIRQYERAVDALRRYDRTVELGLRVVLGSRGIPRPAEPSRSEGRSRKTAVIAFGSDYGLCGPFNDELAERATELFDRLELGPANRVLVSIGDRTGAALRTHGLAPSHELSAPSSVGAIERATRALLISIDGWRRQEEIARVLLLHHRHMGSSETRLEQTQLLPIELGRFRRMADQPWPSKRIPTFTMEPGRLLLSLLREYLAVAVFRAFGEAGASEHASRLQAMQAAEKNIDEELAELRSEFHRRRQDAITAELLDIVSGYEALSKARAR